MPVPGNNYSSPETLPAGIRAPRIAIVGAGPAGCYTAQFLSKLLPGAEIALIDSSYVPYGLVRYGIAPDHQGNKAVTRQFDKMLGKGAVRFYGGVEVGTSIEYETLADASDALVLATGMEADRLLPTESFDGIRVVGAGALMRALNGDPHSRPGVFDASGRRVLVVGNGNVSLDVVRMLVAPKPHFHMSDVVDDRLAKLREVPVESVDVIGRRGASAVKFDPAVLKELVSIPNVRIATVGLGDEESGLIPDILRAATANSQGCSGPVVNFRFNTHLGPASAVSGGQPSIVLTSGSEECVVPVDTIYTAIGFDANSARPDQSPVAGRSNVYTVGWRQMGATGGLAENRRNAKEVAGVIAAALRGTPLESRLRTLDEALVSSEFVDFGGWCQINSYEESRAGGGRCRSKVTDLEQLRALGISQKV